MWVTILGRCYINQVIKPQPCTQSFLQSLNWFERSENTWRILSLERMRSTISSFYGLKSLNTRLSDDWELAYSNSGEKIPSNKWDIKVGDCENRHGFEARRGGFGSSSKPSRRGWGRLETVISRRGLLRSHPHLDSFEDDPNPPSPCEIFGDPRLASKG